MASEAELLALAERCEEASGPDREAFARLDDHAPGSMGWRMIVHPTGQDCVGVVAFARHRQQAEDAMRERCALLERALTDCADELAAEVVARYAGIGDHPAMARKLKRDMSTVVAARAAIAALDQARSNA